AITTVKLFDPKKAYVLTKTGRRGSKSYKTIIVTPNGEFSPLSHASYQQNSDFVNKVNNFITSGENNLSVQQHQREYLNFMSFIFFIMMVAGAYLFTSPKSNCSFYKNLGKLIIERQGLRGTETIEHSLDLILYMEIEQKKVKGGMVYRPVIVLKGLQKIPMMLEFTRQERHISDIVRRINLFLGLQDGY
ncbi:MAG TPA: hypothetical protein VK203_29085, partial [Nostocaceae cyanobacterium]|nr:hypothetical protein [Nostocaceae cyanobacterium]